MTFGKFTAAAFSIFLVIVSNLAASQEYPTKPIRFVVTGPAGGPTDIIARRLSLKLADKFKQQIIIDNRAGGRTVGPGEVAKAAPDGYTLLFTVDTYITVNQWLYKSLPYNPSRDFAPVSIVASLKNFILAVHASMPARNVQEYVALARKNPGRISAANAGSGSPAHLVTSLFALEAKIDLLHVPYKGGNLAISDLMGGYVDSMFAPAQNAIGLIKDGKMIALAVTGNKRIASLPSVSTFAEAGFPGFSLNEGFWYGVLAPAATPQPIIDILAKAIMGELSTEDMRAAYRAIGVDPIGNTPSEFSKIISHDMARWSAVIRDARITVE